jgi:carboxypeptidase Q
MQVKMRKVMQGFAGKVMGAALLAVCLFGSVQVGAAHAQGVDPLVRRHAEKLRDQAMQGTPAYGLVQDLTTLFGPRLGGSEAEKRAAQWAADKLKAMGFSNVRVEEFPIDGWVRGVETGAIISPAPQPIVLTALGYSVPTPPEGLEAEVAIFKTYDDMLAAPVGALAGKIALVVQRTIKVQDGAGYGATGPNRRSGASEAAKRGAVAYLLRSLGTSTNRFAHTGSMRYDADQPKIPAAAISAPDAEQIERLAAQGLPIRMKITITPRLSGPGVSRNVIADIPGTDKADEVVVIGGHIDSWDLGTGALDDGAGVAITTIAAKLILDSGMRPRRTIRLILFGSEEIGLLGARAYVNRIGEGIKRHVIASESDFGAGPIYQFSTRIAPDALWAAKAIGDVLRPIGIDAGNNAAQGGPDLIPFLEKGMPVVELQQDGRDYFDYHHTPNDTIERINPKDLDQNVAAYAVFAFMAASLDVDFRGGKASILE